MFHYLVDGYNLLFRLFRSDRSFTERRSFMVAHLAEYSRLSKFQVTLVFDAYATEEEDHVIYRQAMRLVYTSYGETADDWILAKLNKAKKSSHYQVVSSDQRLVRLARDLGAHTLSAEEFLEELHRRHGKRAGKTEEETKERGGEKVMREGLLDYYEKLFSERYQQLLDKNKEGDGA